jgi:hypothetical protein
VCKDFDNDEKKDLLLKGNFDYAEIERGKYTSAKQIFLKSFAKKWF